MAVGSVVGVVGRVGAGKSSLLAAILSEMEQQGSGAVEVIGGPGAYVPQQSWIISGTIRENVLFGRPIDLARYAAVLTACQLDADLAVMAPTGGDETEIGERVKRPAIRHESLDSFLCGLGSCRQPEFVGSFQGLNLSGGQGLRLSLARAAYQATDPAGGCELVLLDDPLSAVDALVGRSVPRNSNSGHQLIQNNWGGMLSSSPG